MARNVSLAILLLVLSNIFMTLAWYGHLGSEGASQGSFLAFLGSMRDRPWFVAAAVSWGVAFFEYLLQVPANRVASPYLSRAQLKMLQEVLSIAVFAGVAMVTWRERLRLDFLWAGLCILGAVFFVFRDGGDPAPKDVAVSAVAHSDERPSPR